MITASTLARRAWTLTGVLALTFLLGIPAALAHVSVSSPSATKGGYATVTIKVPTESDTASTVGLKLQLPTDTPFASVSVQPKAGWTYQAVTGTFSTPLKDSHGNTITDGTTQIDWTATDGGIKPGEFDTFNISVGPLPNADSVTFKAIQTYSDGTQVQWVEIASGGTEPEHPAPTLSLSTAAAGASSSAASSDDMAGMDMSDHDASGESSTSALSVTAIAVSIVAAVLAIAAMTRSGRRTAGTAGTGAMSTSED